VAQHGLRTVGAQRAPDKPRSGHVLEDLRAVIRDALKGQAILLVEEQPNLARNLQAALERAGAEVLVARNAEEALARLDEFDFSSAILEWRPEARDHPAITRRLREAGVRFVFYATHPPEDVRTWRGGPIIAKTATPEEMVKALALLVHATLAD
jgi:DNA-binding response OmpR family regulator